MTHLTQHWHVAKPVARSRRGIVASQNRIAAEAGARVLASGGNAVDAAVATGFALAACEPWNSGLGGIGYMLVAMAGARDVDVVNFSPISPRRLNPADYPLTGVNVDTVRSTRSVLSADYGDGYRDSAIVGAPGGRKSFTLSSGVWPDDSAIAAPPRVRGTTVFGQP